jgi:nucleolar protein 53
LKSQIQLLTLHSGVISEKTADALFTIDTKGDVGVQRKVLKGSKPLRADQILAQRSALPAVSVKKRAGANTTDGVLPAKRQKTSNYLIYKELTRLRNIADGKGENGVIEVTEATFDPWDEQIAVSESAQDPRFSFLEKKKKKTAPTTLKQRPDGGHSYNPVYDEYEERLTTAGQKEVEAEQKRLEAEEAERVKLEGRAKSAAEADAAEARADMSEWEEDETDWEGFESGVEEAPLSAKRPERKTQVQRNKIKRRKEEERKAKMAADIKKRNDQVSQVKKIAAALKAKEAAQALVEVGEDADESTDDEDLELRRRKLGKIALPEKDLELVLPDELQESLRLLRPEGNLLKDRYRSMLLRGKVEARRPISFAKKPKRKATEKWTHKDFMLH